MRNSHAVIYISQSIVPLTFHVYVPSAECTYSNPSFFIKAILFCTEGSCFTQCTSVMGSQHLESCHFQQGAMFQKDRCLRFGFGFNKF